MRKEKFRKESRAKGDLKYPLKQQMLVRTGKECKGTRMLGRNPCFKCNPVRCDVWDQTPCKGLILY